MRSHEIENWSLSIIDRVLKRQPIEDSRVELKSNWIPAKKAARQIAGHANAARGEPILWLIGLDEEAGTIVGIDFNEFSSWFNEVKACFDELAPEPVSLNIPANGVTIAALYFETDRAPFIVKNSEGGQIQREVPWREATGVKSATRSQLLRLLTPLQKLPEMEIVGSILKVSSHKNQKDEPLVHWSIRLIVFLIQPSDQKTVIASHQCQLIVNISDSETLETSNWIEFKGSGTENVSVTQNLVSIRGSGIFEVLCNISSDQQKENQSFLGKDAYIEFSFLAIYDNHRAIVELTLEGQEQKNSLEGYWSSGSQYL
jgi:hypothetical protein